MDDVIARSGHLSCVPQTVRSFIAEKSDDTGWPEPHADGRRVKQMRVPDA